jgi:hypothetical protein
MGDDIPHHPDTVFYQFNHFLHDKKIQGSRHELAFGVKYGDIDYLRRDDLYPRFSYDGLVIGHCTHYLLPFSFILFPFLSRFIRFRGTHALHG